MIVSEEIGTELLGQRHVEGVGGGHVVPVAPGCADEGHDRGAVEVPGTEAADRDGGLRFGDDFSTSQRRRSTASTSA